MFGAIPRLLSVSFFTYMAASLLHFTHNAVYLSQYPNMPPSISATDVYGTWLLITALGFGGLVLLGRGSIRSGRGILAGYAAVGFDGFAHYLLAPMSSHSIAMNLTIWFEAAAAAWLLLVIFRSAEAVRTRRVGTG